MAKKYLKLFITLLIVVAPFVGGWKVSQLAGTKSPGNSAAANSAEPSFIYQKYDTPVFISIPAIGVDTAVESVGLDKNGNMDVPQDIWHTAWYQNGPYPGEAGSAVIDGHLDSKTGPAIFYHLSKIKSGDKIIIQERNNRTYEFVVYKTSYFSNNTFPVDEVFTSKDGGSYLNLITCTGVFDRSKMEYNQRLVVYSKLSREIVPASNKR